MAHEHILSVEDEKKIALLLKDYLENSGYKASLLDNGKEVESFVKTKNVDLLLLDIMLPGLDGLSVCKNIRQFSEIPIIFITARVEEIDALLGLELGSDDYIRKPFRPREVVARVKAVLRRAQSVRNKIHQKIGVMTLKEEEHIISVNDIELDLTPNEFGILKAFIGRPNKVFTRAELVDRVQGYSFEGYERTIDTHIKNLRKKLAIVLSGKDTIKAVYGVGYKLNEAHFEPNADEL
jgi:two-component system, OmpR family, response regulator BaeR